MAFKTQRSPATGYANAKALAAQLKSYAQGRQAEFSSATNRDVLVSTASDLIRWRDELEAVTQIPGIAQYAKDQENDQAYDVVAEFTAVQVAVDAAISEIVSSFPVSNGALLERQLNPDGTITYLQFTAGQLNTLRGLLGDIDAAIA